MKVRKNVDVVIGLQWGDEGKGKVVDCISENYDIVARYQGGENAGHTVIVDGKKIVLHHLPSGILRDHIEVLLGDGMVVNPISLLREIKEVERIIPGASKRIKIGKGVHLVLPTHIMLDIAAETAKKSRPVGSTRRGIAPAYMDRTGRNGLPFSSIFEKSFKDNVLFLTKKHISILKIYNYSVKESDVLSQLETEWFPAINELKNFEVLDTTTYLYDANYKNKKVLVEGAQGTLLDVYKGTYPYVTSSHTTVGGVLISLGIPHTMINEVYGVFKCYVTRVGEGPFPTEVKGEILEFLRKNGNEYGSTTGRPRRCGWLDIPALNYAIKINGVSKLIISKIDVLSSLSEIQVCIAYEKEGKYFQTMEGCMDMTHFSPVYQKLKGWTSIRDSDTINNFISFIEAKTQTSIVGLSIGAERNAIIWRTKNAVKV